MKLDHLLGGLNQDTFAKNIWNQSVLHLDRNDLMFYDQLLNYEQVTTYLNRRDIRYPAVQIYKNGKELDHSNYLYPIIAVGFASEKLFYVQDLQAKRNDGAIIVINAVEDHFPSIAFLKQSLEDEIKFPVVSTVVLHPSEVNEPAMIQGNNCFIMQLHGWTNFQMSSNLTNPPVSECEDQHLTAKAGDLIFVPKGFAVKTCGGYNDGVYLKVELMAPSWYDLISELITSVNESTLLLRNVVLPHIEANNYAEQLEQVKSIILKSANFDAQLAALQSRFSHKPDTDHSGKFFDSLTVDAITLSTLLGKRHVGDLEICKYENTISINANGTILHFDRKNEMAIDKIFNKDQLTFEEIPETGSDITKMELVQKLIKEGFLKIHHAK